MTIDDGDDRKSFYSTFTADICTSDIAIDDIGRQSLSWKSPFSVHFRTFAQFYVTQTAAVVQ